MLVVTGTKNPTKLAGIERAFKEVFPLNTIEVKGIEVDNIVGKQPIGLEEIFLGAYSRALNASKIVKNADFYVGVEAGIKKIDKYWLDIQLAIVIDRKGHMGIGISPGFPLPNKLLHKILFEKYELEEVVDSYYGTKDIGSHGGFIKILTREKVQREDLVYYATLMALIPWLNADLYELS